MKKIISTRISSKVLISIKGKYIERFILKINKNNIDIYNIKKINENYYELIISFFDFEKLQKINTIYEIKIEKYLGLVNKKRQLLKNYHMIILFLFSILGLYFLSHIIFSVQIVTNDDDMKKRLINTLNKYDIKKYKFIKEYDSIQKIKEEILNEYKEEIQWIEIERKGTKYTIKYEPRIEKNNKNEYKFQHIIAKKNATILKVYSSEGQILKNKYSYVKKGDIIISGYIYMNDKIKSTVKAQGKVYGQTWYIVKVTYPFNYYEEKKTGRKKNVYSIKFFNNAFEIFNFDKFDDKIVDEHILLKSKILPIKFVREYQEEIKIKTSMDDIEQVKLNAINLAYKKINSSLSDDEYIINHKVLDNIITDRGVEMNVFFSICEDIGEYESIEEKKEVE